MTRGSILGIYGILKQDPWNCQAHVVSQQTAQVLEISSDLIKSFTALYPSLTNDLDEVSQRLEVSGRPHIDYIIDKTPLNKDEINFIVQDFKNNRSWKDGHRKVDDEKPDLYGLRKWFDDLETRKSKSYNARERTLHRLQRAMKRLCRISAFYNKIGKQYNLEDLSLETFEEGADEIITLTIQKKKVITIQDLINKKREAAENILHYIRAESLVTPALV